MTYKKLYFWFGLSFVLCVMIHPVSAQNRYQIIGRVVDAESRQPIPSVNVFLTNTTLGSATDRNGEFQIQYIPSGTYDLFIDHIAYKRHIERLDLFFDDVIG
ncbi:carboxypeptidase-like regulatory domain-containing protein, partial [candidate division KSB1 bacterium]|nr:carboxypeptidase-like regulatory domain-containing protein [candidate division KSB1 bacterium]